MMITIRLRDDDVLVCDDITRFKFSLNEEAQSLNVYHHSKNIGIFEYVYGISMDTFIDYIPKLKY